MIAIYFLISLIVIRTTICGRCNISGGRKGQCIDSKQCLPYMLTMSVMPIKYVEFMRHLQCFYHRNVPYVCCPDDLKYSFVNIHTPNKKKIRYKNELSDRFSFNQDEHDCGIQASSDRIFSGTITNIDEYPWMALLQYRKRYPDGRAILACGGVLINRRVVLTAAHCVTGDDIIKLGGLESIRLGEYNIESDTDCIIEGDYEDCADPIVIRKPKHIIIHPDYHPNRRQQYHDIALIKLDEDITFTDFIKPICLPSVSDSNNTIKHGDILTVSGWGRTENYFNSPVKLKVRVPLVNNDQCQRSYKRLGLSLISHQLCAGGDGGMDSCQGDSGGPLMKIDQSTGRWITTGIVSFGPKHCGKYGLPAVYTKIEPYVNWIKSHINT